MTSSPRAARPVLAAAALTCVAAFVAACGSSGSAAAPTATKTVTAPAAGSSSGTAPVTPAPTTSPAGPAGPAPCPTSGLQVKAGLSEGTAGSVYQVIDFRNISGKTCTLFGYPGVSFVTTGAGGGIIGAPAARSGTAAAKLVTLAPGKTANAQLQIVEAGNYPASKCHLVTAHTLQVYPPNQTTPAFLSYTTQTCSKPLRILVINVVQPGSGGQS
jgi:hypothetical protein